MADEYEDYFSSEAHTSVFASTFQETFDGLANLSTEVTSAKTGKWPGLFVAMTRAQATAGAIAHFYSTAGLRRQGAAYFRGLAAQIEAATPTEAAQPDATSKQ